MNTIEKLRKNGILQKYLLDGFHPLHVVTPELLGRVLLYKPGTITTIKANLKILEEANYIVHTVIPTKVGKRPYVYAISTQGKKYLEQECGVEVTVYWKPSEFDRLETPTIWHILELNKFLVEARRVEHFAPTRPHIDFDPREGMIEQDLPAVFLHNMEYDNVFARDPLITSTKQGETIEKNPDAMLEFRIRLAHKTQKARKVFWIELERSRKSPATIRNKILSFFDLYDHGVIGDRYGGAWDVQFVLISTLGNDYLETLRQIAKDAIISNYLEAERNKRDKLLYFATMPPFQSGFVDPEILFFTPYWLHAFGSKTERFPLIDLSRSE